MSSSLNVDAQLHQARGPAFALAEAGSGPHVQLEGRLQLNLAEASAEAGTPRWFIIGNNPVAALAGLQLVRPRARNTRSTESNVGGIVSLHGAYLETGSEMPRFFHPLRQFPDPHSSQRALHLCERQVTNE